MFRDFEVFGYQVEHFIKEFKPIHAFYVLEKCDDDVMRQLVNGGHPF